MLCTIVHHAVKTVVSIGLRSDRPRYRVTAPTRTGLNTHPVTLTLDAPRRTPKVTQIIAHPNSEHSKLNRPSHITQLVYA